MNRFNINLLRASTGLVQRVLFWVHTYVQFNIFNNRPWSGALWKFWTLAPTSFSQHGQWGGMVGVLVQQHWEHRFPWEKRAFIQLSWRWMKLRYSFDLRGQCWLYTCGQQSVGQRIILAIFLPFPVLFSNMFLTFNSHRCIYLNPNPNTVVPNIWKELGWERLINIVQTGTN